MNTVRLLAMFSITIVQFGNITIYPAQAQVVDRSKEGDWYVSDDTDNNTGERTVYAINLHLERGDPDYVTLTMRCSKGKPTLFVEWDKVMFPDQAVLSIGGDAEPNPGLGEERYIFEKSEDPVENGLRASPATSARIVAALATAKYATVTAHLSYGRRTVGMKVGGTQEAWNRVTRHCPIRIMPVPPL